MGSFPRRTVFALVANDRAWRVLDATVLKFARYAEFVRREHVVLKASREAIAERIPDLTVRHGPFAGMRYPSAESAGSSLFPKLLGSYERELHPVLQRICATPYTHIVDVGCAEGYYAVGLAMRVPTATVFAYDTETRALELCARMAELNGVAERVVTGGLCDASLLASVRSEGRRLVVCDAEGYERSLFNEESLPTLGSADVLIEVHDMIDISISDMLAERFAATHDLEVVSSVDDIRKAHDYDYEELAGYDLETRLLLLGERRASIMEWFFLTPRSRP